MLPKKNAVRVVVVQADTAGGGRGMLFFQWRGSLARVTSLFHIYKQGYGRGVAPNFTHGSKPKKGIPLDQGDGRGVPPIFTPGPKPKNGIPLGMYVCDNSSPVVKVR